MIARRAVPLFAVVTLLASVLVLGLSPRAAGAQPSAKTHSTTTVQPQPVATYFVLACTHDGYVSVSTYKCAGGGDSIRTGSKITPFSGADIKSQELTVTLKDGRRLTQQLQPGTDAVMMSNVAIEKFLLPYYERVKDAKSVADLRALMAKLGRMAPAKPQPSAPK